MLKILQSKEDFIFFGFHFSKNHKLPESINKEQIYLDLLINIADIFKRAIES